MERPQKPAGQGPGPDVAPGPRSLLLSRPGASLHRALLCSALLRSALLLSALPLLGCGEAAAPRADVAAETAVPAVSGVHIRPVPGVPRMPAGPPDEKGKRALVACSTCHSIKPATPTQRGGADLEDFHQGLQVTHGSLTCLSCHNAGDYDTLRLADGRSVAFEDVKDLCAQCHGPQASAYAHGAHGGMSGYWDTTRGVQVRNQCTHCHAPHAPAFPQMRPTFKPRDRFLTPHEAPSTSTGAR